MSTTMLFYSNVTPLDRNEHKDLKLKPVDGLSFAEKTHWLPLAGGEFYPASRHYPIIFVKEKTKDGGETHLPLLLVGLENGVNDFIDAQHHWKANVYLPAFVRRYPFVPADPGNGQKADEFMVCFDASFPGFNKKEGQALFNADGSDSDFLKNAIQFLTGFKNDMDRARAFATELTKLDLLETRSAEIRNPAGAKFNLQDFVAVSEEKFAKLTGDQLEQLHKQGFLGWIFAHLMSLGNLPNLLDLHVARKSAVVKH